jgi:hypothetical protein
MLGIIVMGCTQLGFSFIHNSIQKIKKLKDIIKIKILNFKNKLVVPHQLIILVIFIKMDTICNNSKSYRAITPTIHQVRND